MTKLRPIMELVDTPEMRAQVRAELLHTPSPRMVARRLGLPKALVSRWRCEFLQDPEFMQDMRNRRADLICEAEAAFARGIEVAMKIARTGSETARVQAAKVLISALGELQRGRPLIADEQEAPERPKIEIVHSYADTTEPPSKPRTG